MKPRLATGCRNRASFGSPCGKGASSELAILVVGVTDVAKSYDQIMQERRASLAEDAAEVRAVFEQACDLAMQLVELRERRGWSQAELASRCGVDQGDISR